ncbi:hypothetical protein V501_01333 [Pseudogymnoascus sp. VKM F-4519 (FW-2642)]|nr:hypothetical protein V501_01333 [Pseudogymnoascus sp. VKM F-4519 (FW-2642)]
MACPVSANFTKYQQQRGASPVSTQHEKPSLDHSIAPAPPVQDEKKPFVAGVTPEEFHSPNWAPEEMRKVVREAILLAAGCTAILLQVANPGVGAGVNLHSNFAYYPIDRLRTTMTYVYCMSFGTPQEKEIIVDKVHRAHAPVQGPGYSANNPELQLWVAATMYATGIDIYEKLFGKFDQETAEKIYRQFSIFAISLRVPPEMWPANRVAFWEYWDTMISQLTVSPHASNIAKDLLWNKKGPLWMRANLPLIRLLTAEWLPPALRDAYGLKTSKLRRAIYIVLMESGKIMYPLLPLAIRCAPMKHYMQDMRKHMKSITAPA